MREEVLYVELPEGAKYRKVIVTSEGEVYIVYSMKDIKKPAVNEQNINEQVEIPKPERLVGGTEVYKKQGIPYWFCKIKNGRDEFMHLYMEDLIEEDLLYDSINGEPREFTTWQERKFKDDVLKALSNKPPKGYRWLPVFEPVSDGSCGIQYIKGEKPLVEHSCYEWEELLNQYSPDNQSCMASSTTYFLLLLRWLKDGLATVTQLANYSTDIGHYWDSKNTNHDLEATGDRSFGGLYGLVGNTCKFVKNSDAENDCFMVGGSFHFFGIRAPLAHVRRIKNLNGRFDDTVGLLELKR